MPAAVVVDHPCEKVRTHLFLFYNPRFLESLEKERENDTTSDIHLTFLRYYC